MKGQEGRERSRGIPSVLMDAFFLLLPWIVLAFLAKPMLSLGWALADELNVLLLAKEFAPAEYFLDPHVYRLLSSNNLTPWTILSHAGDIGLWNRMSESVSLSRIVRIHELVAAGLLVNVTYLFSRLRLSPTLAGVVVVILTFSWPLVDGAVGLPSRHYVEGAIFAVLALFFYTKAHGTAGRASSVCLLLSAGFYLLSVTAKEVFVPLPVFLFLVDRRGLRDRLRDLAGHLVVVVAYVVWRVWMLGNLVGGYPTSPQGVDIMDFVAAALSALGLLPEALFLGMLASAVFLILLGILGAYALIRGPLSLRDILALVLCLGVPILPVVPLVEAFGVDHTGRYFLVIAWAFAVLFGLGLAVVRSGALRAAAVVLVVVAIGFSVPATLNALEKRRGLLAHRSMRCGAFVLERGPETVLFLSGGLFSTSYVTLLARMKEAFTGETPPWIVEDAWLLPVGFEAMEVFEMRARSGTCYTRSPEWLAELVRERDAMRVDPVWHPEIEWLPDGVRLLSSDPAPTGTSLLIRGVPRGLRLYIPPGGDRVSGLRKALWSRGVKRPAGLRLARLSKHGGVRVSRVVEVPQRFWDAVQP